MVDSKFPIALGQSLSICASVRRFIGFSSWASSSSKRPGVEVIEDGCYRRTIEVDDEPGEIEVRLDHDEPRLQVRVKLSSDEHLMQVIERVRRMSDVGADPLQIASHLSRDPQLKPLLEARPGLRVPGVWDGFELAVRAVLGQQLTTGESTRIVGRLVRAFGKPVESSMAGLTHVFPCPQLLAHADLSRAGLRGASAKVLRALARAVCMGDLTFEATKSLEETIRCLCAIRGIGDQKAHLIAMRAFGEPDAFPCRDLGLRRAAGDRRHPVSPAELLRIAEGWRPWRAYAAMHLWAADSEASSRHHRG